jgi:hypothetical protein
MDLFHVADTAGNVLLLTQNFWTLGEPTGQLPGNTSVFYTIPGSQTLISASVVTTAGQPVYAGPGGASPTPTRINLPETSAGNGNVSVAVTPAGAKDTSVAASYLTSVSSVPGTTLPLSNGKQAWTLPPATTCYYMRTSEYAYVRWDGATAFTLVLDVASATLFEYLNGVLYVHGTYDNSSASAVAVVVNGTAVVAAVVALSVVAPALASIQPDGAVLLGAQYVADTLSGTLALCPLATPARLCTMQPVPPADAPRLVDMICYQWVTRAPGFLWPLRPLPPPPDPSFLTPIQKQILAWSAIGLVIAIIITLICVYIWYQFFKPPAKKSV